MESKPDVASLYKIQAEHTALHAEIGLVSSGWSMFEFQMNTCIWTLAGVNPVSGACITAQIFSINPRIDCLLSLMALREVDSKWIKRTNSFKQLAITTQEKRNRLIHDPIIYDLHSRQAGQIEITAKAKPVFRIKTLSLEDVVRVRRDVLHVLDQFGDIAEGVLATRDTWPEIPRPEADPMQVIFVLDTKGRSQTTRSPS